MLFTRVLSLYRDPKLTVTRVFIGFTEVYPSSGRSYGPKELLHRCHMLYIVYHILYIGVVEVDPSPLF